MLATGIFDSILNNTNRNIIAILLICVVVLLYGAISFDGDFLTALSTMRFRNENSFIYYAYGIACGILTIDLSLRVTKRLGDERVKPCLFLGRNSLFIFCFGNCLLYLTRSSGLSIGHALSATYASVISAIALSLGYSILRNRMITADASSPVVSLYNYVTKGFADYLATLLIYRRSRR
jgi:fucose 4-O-acetylase-like acetyltransferase